MPGSAFAVTDPPFSNGAGGTTDGNGSNWSPSKIPSYTKSVSSQHHLITQDNRCKKITTNNVVFA